jgi:hypothetical protein
LVLPIEIRWDPRVAVVALRAPVPSSRSKPPRRSLQDRKSNHGPVPVEGDRGRRRSVPRPRLRSQRAGEQNENPKGTAPGRLPSADRTEKCTSRTGSLPSNRSYHRRPPVPRSSCKFKNSAQIRARATGCPSQTPTPIRLVQRALRRETKTKAPNTLPFLYKGGDFNSEMRRPPRSPRGPLCGRALRAL